MDSQHNAPPIPPPIDEMNKIALWVLESLKNQGLSFLLLGIAVWHLEGKNVELSKSMVLCQEEKYNALIEVVKQNTEALINLANGQEDKAASKPKR